jgi:hypothetical protein
MQSYWRKKERELNEISKCGLFRKKEIETGNRTQEERGGGKRDPPSEEETRVPNDLVLFLLLVYG